MAYIYIHTCPNGKKYIGTTQLSDPKDRWDSGWGYKKNTHFWNAIQKYGWDNIIHQVIEVDTVEDMWYGEKYLIAYYDTTNPENGYNKSIGGEHSSFGCHFHMSKESIKKISESKKGEKNPNFGKKGVLNHRFGIHTPYYGGGMKKGTIIKKHKWLSPNGDILVMGMGQAHRFHPDWILVE